MKPRNIYIISLFVALFAAAFTACKDDDIKYEMTDDLFRPKLVQDALVKTNTILLVWHEIYDAKSYTIEMSLDKQFNELFRVYDEYERSILLIDDIPYQTKFFIRLRSNSPVSPKHNSSWTEVIEVTTPKRIVSRVLTLNKDNDLGKDFVILKWEKDYENNPVDSIGISSTNVSVPSQGRTLTAEDLDRGYVQFDGLLPNTAYTANIYNTKEPSVYDRPYNEIRFRTSGDPVNPIPVPAGTNLTEWFYRANYDTSIPDGATYVLQAGKTYILTNKNHTPEGYWEMSPEWDGVRPNKGFTLLGESSPTEGRPKVQLAHWFSLEGDVSIMAFENIDFVGYNSTEGGEVGTNPNYLVNFDWEVSLEQLVIRNCTFRNVGRGIIRTKGNNTKNIQSIEISNTRFYDLNFDGYSFMQFNSTDSNLNDLIENISIEESSFINCNRAREWITGDKVRSLEELSIINCTFYDVASQNVLVNLPSSNYSAIIENNLFAGGTLGGGTSLRGHTGSYSAVENYTTDIETTAQRPIGATYLGNPVDGFDESTLFENVSEYNFRIIDDESPVYENYVGDPYWLQ